MYPSTVRALAIVSCQVVKIGMCLSVCEVNNIKLGFTHMGMGI